MPGLLQPFEPVQQPQAEASGRPPQERHVVRNQQQAQAAMSAASGPQLDALSDEELEALIATTSASIESK